MLLRLGKCILACPVPGSPFFSRELHSHRCRPHRKQKLTHMFHLTLDRPTVRISVFSRLVMIGQNCQSAVKRAVFSWMQLYAAVLSAGPASRARSRCCIFYRLYLNSRAIVCISHTIVDTACFRSTRRSNRSSEHHNHMYTTSVPPAYHYGPKSVRNDCHTNQYSRLILLYRN